MKSKFVWILIVLLFVVTNLFWFYNSFDKSVSIDYMKQGVLHNVENAELLKKLIVDLSTSQGSEVIIEKMVNEKYTEYLIKREGKILFIDSVGLKFEGGELKEIVLINEVEPKI